MSIAILRLDLILAKQNQSYTIKDMKVLSLKKLMIIGFGAMGLLNPSQSLASTKDVDSTIATWLKMAPQSAIERPSYFSEKLLNKPYKFRSFGEGPDADIQMAPIYHLDSFDCVNFVEIVTAMVCSSGITEFKSKIIDIRYLNKEISFIQRAHFSETDWIPNAIKKGFLKDSTLQLFPKDFKNLTGTINKKKWLNNLNLDYIRPPAGDMVQLRKKLQKLSENQSTDTFNLPYLPKSVFQRSQALKDIPDGAVVHFLYLPKPSTADYFGTDYFVQHVGFLIKKKDGIFLRSASSEMKNRVVNDRDFATYLKNLSEDEKFLGINIMEFNFASFKKSGAPSTYCGH